MIVNSVDRAVSRYDTLNKFPKVLEQMGFNKSISEATQRLSDSVQDYPLLDDVVATTTSYRFNRDLDTSVDTTIALNNAFLASGSERMMPPGDWSSIPRCFPVGRLT